MCNSALVDGDRFPPVRHHHRARCQAHLLRHAPGQWEAVGRTVRALGHAPCWPAQCVVCVRRPFYDLSVGLSAVGILVPAEDKPLGEAVAVTPAVVVGHSCV